MNQSKGYIERHKQIEQSDQTVEDKEVESSILLLDILIELGLQEFVDYYIRVEFKDETQEDLEGSQSQAEGE